MDCLIESFGFKIYIKVEGAGLPVVLLHSLWGNHTLFDNFSQQLSGQYKVIRIDFPGHGNSASPLGNFSFEEFAAVINDLLNQLDIKDEINLIGHSMGGFAALAFSRLHRERVASLILVHTLAKGPDSKSIRNRLRQMELIRCDKKNLLLQFANESNFAPGNAPKFPLSYACLEVASNQVTREGALAAIHAINTRQNGLPFLMNANIPTLFVIGKQDRIYDPDDQLWEQQNIPGAEVLLLQHSGHLGFFEEETVFNDKIDSFLCSIHNPGREKMRV